MRTVQRWYKRARFLRVAFLVASLALLTVENTTAQTPATPAQGNQPAAGTPAAPASPPGAQDKKGPTVDTVSPTYRPPDKDPFSDPNLVRKKGAPAEPVAYPPLAERQAKWRERRNYNLDHNLPPPDPTEQYLVDEFDVKGVFATDKGLGALLKVKGGTATLFVREGAKFWNGSVTKIDKSPYRDLAKGTVAGTVICSEVTLYSDKTVKTGQRPLTYVPRP